MNKSMRYYLGGMLLLILLFFWVGSLQEKPVDWSQHYSLDTKNPYDLYVFNAEIKRFMYPTEIQRAWLTPYEYIQNNPKPATYLIVDKNIHSLSVLNLLDKVAEGSTLFISAENFFNDLVDTLGVRFANIDSELEFDAPATNYLKLSLTNKSWGTETYRLSPVNNQYAFIHLNRQTTTILGTQTKANGQVSPNFIRIKYGKGFVFLHNQPQVFTNKALLDKNSSSKYIANLLSYLPSNRPVVWFINGQTNRYGMPEEKTPLSIVFQYPALRMSWLIFIYGLLLFVLFRIKRRQRIIPVIEPLKNTTVDFVHTISNLYFQEESATEMMEKKITYFLDKIRTRYYLDTSVLDEKFELKLQLKSGKDIQLIGKIIRTILLFRKSRSALSDDLVKMNDLIEKFWEKES